MVAITPPEKFSDSQIAVFKKIYIRIAMMSMYMWLLYFLFWVIRSNSEAVIGADFRAFYTGGIMIDRNVGEQLYSLPQQFYWQQTIFPQLHDIGWLLPFMNPPFVAGIFLPFTLLPIKTAYIVWSVLQLVLLTPVSTVAVKMLQKSRWQIRATALVMILTFMP